MSSEQSSEFLKILNRFKIIETLIILQEEKEIKIQIEKLKQFQYTNELQNIIDLLERKNYNQAKVAIERFSMQNNNLFLYSELEIESLKSEVKKLESEINNLSNEKADSEKLIQAFGLRHSEELGELTLKILYLLKNKAKGTTREEETNKEYEDYNTEYEINKNEKIDILSKEQQNELKQKYRRASKLCHPDVVNEEQKDLAEKLFAELNNHYAQNNLEKVSDILEKLEKGDFFSNKSDTINKRQLLKIELEKLFLVAQEIKNQISNIKESEIYKTINNIGDWDSYFKNAKHRLENQLKDLENGK